MKYFRNCRVSRFFDPISPCFRIQFEDTFHAVMKLPLPSRIPILYLILIVLIAVGVVPLYFYATKMVVRNRETLGRNEKLLQNMVTTTLAQSIAQREKDISATLTSLSYSITVTSGGNLSGKNVENADVKALLQNYIESPDSIVPYARLVNTENNYATKVNAGIQVDAFLEHELDRVRHDGVRRLNVIL